jgi:hypothetical protein
MKSVPQADAKSASMGWFFDPGFIQNVQRVAADVEDPSMESIDSVLFALREMGYIRTAETCEHGFSVDECVEGMCELQTENAILRARVARLEEAIQNAIDYANGREAEWGSRAEDAFAFLYRALEEK